MTDTSNADNSPDSLPSGQSPLGSRLYQPANYPTNQPPQWKQILDDWNQSQQRNPQGTQTTDVWQRGQDQPTTVGGFQPQPPRPPPQPPRPPPPNPMSGTWQPGPKSPLSRLSQVPPGTRLPPPPMWQPYLKPFPNREHSQWGQPEPFAALPQQFELPGLYQSLGQFFGQNGAGQSPIFSMLMGSASGAYQKGVLEGKMALMKLSQEQLSLNSAKLEENEQRSLNETADILAEYEAAANQTDPDKVGNFAIGGVDLRTALEQKAQELDNKPLMGLLASGAPMSKIVGFLKVQDANWRALHAANKKASEASAEDTLWGMGGATGAGEGGTGIQEGMPATQPETAGAQPTTTSELTGGEKPDITGFAPSNPLHQKVMDGVQGTLDTTGLDKAPATKVAVSKGIDAVNSRLDAIANDHNLTPDQVKEKVKEISPEFADQLKNVTEYRRPIAGIAGGGSPKEMAYNSRLTRLAERVKPADPSKNLPGWNQSTYKAVQDFRDESQKQNSPIQRIPTSVAAAQQVLNDLDLIQKRDGNGANLTLDNLIKRAAQLDPLYQKLRADWLNYMEDISVLTIGPQVGLTKMGEADVPWYGNAETYREVVKSHMGVADSRVKQLHNQWDSYGTGDPMPGYSQQAEGDMVSIRNMDPTSGLLPGQPLKDKSGKTIAIYTGKNPSDPNSDENWQPQ